MRKLGVAFVLSLSLAAPAGSAAIVQSEWTRPGAAGPLRDPGGAFLEAAGIDWWSNPGRLGLGLHPLCHGIGAVPGGISDILCRDMDCDGDSDIVACGPEAGLVIYENAGAGGSFRIHPVLVPGDSGPERLACGDLDGDGYPDLAGSSRSHGSLRWWENAGAGPWPQHGLDPGGVAGPLDAADLDGDGDIELLVGMWDTGGLVVMEHGRSGTGWSRKRISSRPSRPSWVEVHPDGRFLAAASPADSALLYWELQDGAWTPGPLVEAAGSSCALGADMDGDGRPDLLACSREGDRIFWLSLAPEAAGETTVSRRMMAPARLRAADMDGDGDADVLAASEAAGELAWWESADGGESFFERYVGSFPGCSCCDAGDMDGDGGMDLVAASITDGSVGWWTLDEYRSEGSLTSSIIWLGRRPRSCSVELFGSAPAGTSLGLAVRVSSDRTRMGPWTEVSGRRADLAALADDGDRFLQYRVLLSTSRRDITPHADSVRIVRESGSPR
ncbi:MAG: VCBS repeat-containing protein [Candidatus Fermentibacteraceae bacterium]